MIELKKMSKPIIYQVLTRLWGKGKFSSFDDQTFDYLHSLSVTHIWYTGIVRHASGKPFVKGDPGSPYSISDYYDVNPYLADKEDERISEFKDLLMRSHASGFKVITDFIPNHVACDYSDSHGGIPTFPYCDYDWTDTSKINYSDSATWNKMYDIVRYWAEMGVDGFRCDMVELVDPAFFKWLIDRIKTEFPGTIFVAEVYNKDNYWKYIREVGFDYLYDKSGLYDSLMAIYRHGLTAESITWNWQFLGELQPSMLNFLENHDEVRVASRDFAYTPQRAFAALAPSVLLGTAPFMLYFGEEVGEAAADTSNCRTSIFNWKPAKAVDRLYAHIHDGKANGPEASGGASGAGAAGALSDEEQAILARYREVLAAAALPAFADGSIHDLGYCSSFDRRRFFAWLRYDDDDMYLIVSNFSDEQGEAWIHNPLTGEDCSVVVAPMDYKILKIK